MNLFKLKTTYLNYLNRPFKQIQCNLVKSYSVQAPVVKEQSDKTSNDPIQEFERLSKITPKTKVKNPQRPPFVKNLFVGIYDTDILTYPQMEKEDIDNLNKDLEPVYNYFNENQQTEDNTKDDLIENLRRLKLFGLQSSQLIGGRELGSSETFRFNEVMCSNTSGSIGLLHNEHLGIQAINKNGTEEQKRKYLPQLVNGQTLSAFCITEKDLSDVTKLQTKATLEPNKKFWILNGEKASVVNGAIADLYVIVAQTEELNRLGVKENKLTSFLVEKGFGEITSSPCDVLGIQDTNIVDLKFENVRVPTDNVLGDHNVAENVIKSLLNDIRLGTGSACSALNTKLIDNLVNYCTFTSVGNMYIADTDYVKSIVAKLCVTKYAIESTLFLTTGLIDQFENQDCDMEAAVVKVFSSQETSKSILQAMELIGNDSYLTHHWLNTLHRDSLSHLLLHESSENLKLKIALMGLQHAGMQLQEKIKIARNPLFHPAATFKRMWEQRKQLDDDPKLNLHLGDYLHPSAVMTSQMLEYCVLRLQYATETLFARYGIEVINNHMDLLRLAECAIDVYVMTACLSRASRAYCIGLQHADYEMLLANSFCYIATERVKHKINEIVKGPFGTNDETYKKVANGAFKFNKYFPLHPLTRNF